MRRFTATHKGCGVTSLEEALRHCKDPVLEPKLDGWRVTAEVTETRATIRSGFGNRIEVLPEIEQELARVLPAGTIVDGEAVHTKTYGAANVGWGSVQSVLSRQSLSTERDDICFAVFDVVQIPTGHGDPIDISSLPFRQRRRWLKTWMGEINVGVAPHLALVPQFDATNEMVELLMGQGFEGVMIKDLASAYRQGVRGRGSYKLKWEPEEDVEVIGFTAGQGKYDGMIGAVRFRLEDGTEGACSGMTDAVRQDMTDHPENYIGKTMEIAHGGRMPGGVLRWPRFRRMRPDKEVTS